MKPLIDIIIPAYNSEKYLKTCLDSLIAQTCPRWTAMVVLAPSTDNTENVLNGFSKEPRIHVIRERVKTNCATARNIGFNNTSCKYVAFLDSDDWWEPTKLEVQLKHMMQSADQAWAMHQLIVEDNGKQTIWEIPDSPCLDKDKGLLGGLWTIVFQRNLLNNVKKEWGYLFNQNMKHTDDADLVMRMWEYPHSLIPIPLAGFRRNPDGLTSKANGFLESDLTTIGIALRNHRYSLLSASLFKNIFVTALNRVTGIDWVKVKKERFG